MNKKPTLLSVITDGLLLVLFLSMLAMPITYLGLFGYKENAINTSSVLSETDKRDSQNVVSSPNSSTNKVIFDQEAESLIRNPLPSEILESTESTQSNF